MLTADIADKAKHNKSLDFSEFNVGQVAREGGGFARIEKKDCEWVRELDDTSWKVISFTCVVR